MAKNRSVCSRYGIGRVVWLTFSLESIEVDVISYTSAKRDSTGVHVVFQVNTCVPTSEIAVAFGCVIST